MNISLPYCDFLGSLFLDGSTSGPGSIIENFSSSSSLFGKSPDVVDTGDSDGEESYAYSRCSRCSPPTTKESDKLFFIFILYL